MLEKLDNIIEFKSYLELNTKTSNIKSLSDKELITLLINFILSYFKDSINTPKKINYKDKLESILEKYHTESNNLYKKKADVKINKCFSDINNTLVSISDYILNQKLENINFINSINISKLKNLNSNVNSPLKSKILNRSLSLASQNNSKNQNNEIKNPILSIKNHEKLSRRLSNKPIIPISILHKGKDKSKTIKMKGIKECKIEYENIEIKDNKKLYFFNMTNEIIFDSFLNGNILIYSKPNEILLTNKTLNDSRQNIFIYSKQHDNNVLLTESNHELKSYLEENSTENNKQREKPNLSPIVKPTSSLIKANRNRLSSNFSFNLSSFKDINNYSNIKSKPQKEEIVIYNEYDEEKTTKVNCFDFENDLKIFFDINENSYLKIKGADCRIIASMLLDSFELETSKEKLNKMKDYVLLVKNILNSS